MDRAWRDYDFLLVVVSVAILASIGILFMTATFIAWSNTLVDSNWPYSLAYQEFVLTMNSLLFPLLVALLVVLGLCLPKRLWVRKKLIEVNAMMLAIGLAAWLWGGIDTGLAAYVLLCLSFQSIIVVMTAAGSRALRFEIEGRLARLGSSILHFGFVLMTADFVIWARSDLHLTIFWAATASLLLGSFMAFYSQGIVLVSRKLFGPAEPDTHGSLGLDPEASSSGRTSEY